MVKSEALTSAPDTPRNVIWLPVGVEVGVAVVVGVDVGVGGGPPVERRRAMAWPVQNCVSAERVAVRVPVGPALLRASSASVIGSGPENNSRVVMPLGGVRVRLLFQEDQTPISRSSDAVVVSD